MQPAALHLGVMPAQFIENYGTNLFDTIDPEVGRCTS
jgi:hypothetical protein